MHNWTAHAAGELNRNVLRALPHLSEAEVTDITRIVDVLLQTFWSEAVYVFGSQARGSSSRHSDVDLFVLMHDVGEFLHRLAQV